MDKKMNILVAWTFASSLVAATGLGQVAQAQASCGLSQDDIVARVGSSLAPGSNTLIASPGRLGGAAAGLAGSSPGCGVDIVVAIGTIRPDAVEVVAEAVAEVLPDQQDQLAAAAESLGSDDILPGAGYDGPYESPYDDDRLDDDDDDGVSPA